jgi:hypothetical protein
VPVHHAHALEALDRAAHRLLLDPGTVGDLSLGQGFGLHEGEDAEAGVGETAGPQVLRDAVLDQTRGGDQEP